MSEWHSIVRLREIIDAKVQRRLDLLAEIAGIEAELAEAHVVLGDVPSLSPRVRHVEEATATADLVVRAKPKKVHPEAVRTCGRCASKFMG